MDQENYNDIDMEIEMDSNDIDVSAEMPNEIVVNNYNSLKNKPSINSVELVGNKTLEDLGITEYVEGEIANFDFIKIVPQLPEKGLINRTYFVPKTDPESNDLYEEYMWINNKWEMMGTKQIQVDLTAYVKNTDYAKPNKGGTIKTGNGVSLKNGVIQTDSIDYNAYKDSPNEYFIGKGTLEKVIEGKELINKEYSDNIVEEQRLENERLRNDIKSIALPGEASGENIHIEDSSDARCEIEICGNQKQNTREGYNLLNLEKYVYSETISIINGGKIEVSKGIVNLNGTNATARMIAKSKDLASSEFDIIPAGTYFFGVNCNLVPVSGGSLLQPNLGIQELKEDYYLTQWYAICDVNKTESYPLLISKDTQKTTYEQYGASPSIDYPSKVKSVGNIKNILDMSNAKGGTSGGITCTMNKDGSYTYKGTASSKAINIWLLGSYTDNTSIFRLEPGTYYIDGVVLFDGNNALANPDIVKIFTFIYAHDITGVRALDAVSGNTYDETKYPIIAKIDHEIPWIPYDCGYAKVDIVNENIFNTENVKSTSEVSVVDNKNGVLELQGVNGYWKGITTTQKFETGKRVYIKCKYVAGTGSSGNIGISDVDGNSIVENHKVTNYSISCSFISKGITKIFFRCNGASNTGHIKYSDIMFSYKDIDYIPHQEQSYLVDVQQPMFEGDTFVRQDGKWYEKHCWKKMLLNGTEKVGVSVASTNEILAIVYDINNAVDGFGYSNYFLYSSQLELNKMSVYNGGKSLRINVSKMQFADLESFKAKVKELYEAGTPVIIYYKLAEPILLECTEAQSKVLDEIYNKIHTYKNITNISAESAEINPIVNVKYLKDTEKYIEDKITTALTEINALNQVRTQMLDAEVEI